MSHFESINKTEQKPSYEELETQLIQAKKKIAELEDIISKGKERFHLYTNLSHDLRSPIAAISSSAEYLLSFDNLEKEEITSALKLIQTRSHFLENMIGDIFMLSSINYTDRKLQLEEVEIGLFLEEYFYECAADSKYNNRILHLQVPMDLECVVMIDPELMIRVLDNLFTNALKYSHPGDDIWLSAELTPAGKLQFCVTDSGIGIPSEHLEHVFDRSFMVSEARTPSAQSGCGLGLAIVKSIVQKHNGKIWCESELGKGSSFIVELEVLSTNPIESI